MKGYRRDERYKLSDELRKDIFAWEHFIGLHNGDTREEIASELSKHCSHWSVRIFRHLDLAAKERDYAFDMLNQVSKYRIPELQERYNTKWLFTETESNDLLDYCHQEGLGLLLTALDGMVAIGNEEYRDKFPRVQRYTNLKNVLTSYEYLLKSLGEKANLDVGGKTLTQTVRKVMCKEDWIVLFESGTKQGLSRAENSEEFLAKYDMLSNDNELKDTLTDYWARTFLITCLARNFTVHSYPSEDRYYGDLFGTMLHSVITAMFYTWKLAKREGWV